MKKIISNILAFVMIFSSILPSININEVRAAQASFRSDLNRSMSVGLNNPTPVLNNSPNPDQVFLEWDLSTMNIGHYELTYPIENGKEATFIVNKSGDSAVVEYSVTGTTLPNSFFIHTNMGANQQPRFRSHAEYLRDNNGGPEFDIPWDPDNPPVLPAGSFVFNNTTPTFRIQRGSGFSFQYDNSTMNFRWDEVTNNLYFVADRIMPGFIHPFTLGVGASQNHGKSYIYSKYTKWNKSKWVSINTKVK